MNNLKLDYIYGKITDFAFALDTKEAAMYIALGYETLFTTPLERYRIMICRLCTKSHYVTSINIIHN
jgi:hypothetical protein